MRDDLDPDALSALAIFPLPNAVLLPGGLLPLHVFEPRYRELTRDCLDGSRLMGVARLRSGYEASYHGRPAVHGHLGVGRIIASEELPDGRYHILLRGIARVRIDEELPATKAYREVRARLLTDDSSRRPAALASCHGQLVALCDRLAMTLDKGGDQLRELVRSQATPGACADLVTAALVTDADTRQLLLETLDPADRLERAIDHIGRLLCELAPCSGAPN
jgi:Lon protease-like protein